MRRLPALLCAVLVACSPSPPDEPAPSPAPATATPAPSAEAPCPNQDDVVADEALAGGDSASGDVDGDGAPESVSVHFDPEGSPGCQAFVVAASDDGVVAGALTTWRTDFGLPAPNVKTLQEVDGEPGLEIVVDMGAGASTQFVGIVTAEDGRLEQVTSETGDNTVAEGLFGYGGSVGHLEAVDCAPGGGVVSSFAAPDGRAYRVERRFLVFDGTRLVEDRVEVERGPLGEIGALPEYRASPFGSCTN